MLALILALAASVQQGPKIVQPTTYVSPSGEWRLSVDPSTRFGDGEPQVAVMDCGARSWNAELPYALREAFVIDAAVVAGYALIDGRVDPAGSSQLVVAIIAPDGEAVLEERVERKASRARARVRTRPQ